LLNAIRKALVAKGQWEAKEEHFRRLYEINKDIEATIAKRHSIQDYEEWLTESGFTITYRNPSGYAGAVAIFHAKKALSA
jgi:hypothetical protein